MKQDTSAESQFVSGRTPKEINALFLDCSTVDSGVVVEESDSNSGFIETTIKTFSCCLPDWKYVSPVS